MARTRKQHHRHSIPSSSSASSNKTHKHSSSIEDGRKIHEEDQDITLENSTLLDTMEMEADKLELGTDEESENEEDIAENDDHTWKQVTKEGRKSTKQSSQVTQLDAGIQVNKTHAPLIQLNMEDVEEGIDYWANSIYCYVLGANPPWTVLEGYAHRIWKGKIEQVSFMPNGIFLVRFNSKEAQQEAVFNDALLFDSKPVIIEEWTPNANLIKKEIKEIPIWIKLRKLELRFWGERCFAKLVSGIGRYIECDKATKTKQFLGFAKVKVMVKLDQFFPKTVEFLDEMGKNQLIGLDYDWLPVTCVSCKNIGHSQGECRKGKSKTAVPAKVWQPKGCQPAPKGAIAQTPSNSLKDPLPTTTVLRTDSSIKAGIVDEEEPPDSPQLFQMGGTSFLEKLTLSIKKDMTKKAELEAGVSLLHG